jgi:hypothetical protein
MMSDQPASQPEKQQPAKKGGYSKRPVWQWILLYAIVAAIVYYAVYLIFFHHTGGATSSSSGYSY